MYEVIKPFRDLTDGEHKYMPGDKFPRTGKKASAERIEELATDKNRCGYPVIAERKTTRRKK